jgi:hypothetical protein
MLLEKKFNLRYTHFAKDNRSRSVNWIEFFIKTMYIVHSYEMDIVLMSCLNIPNLI